MDRTNEILIPTSTRWLSDQRAQTVCSVIADAGHAIYFVGGCVRNALLGLQDSDVDMSTDALPQDVMSLAGKAGLKAIPTGIDHGTVTIVVDGAPFEVTTFRRDVETDGRRAVVAFSKDISDDARRRDFTMNALYATPSGQVIDPLHGLPDLLARRIRFIEDADARIKEDYLRILRFFRFSAWYADPDQGFEPETLAAISANNPGLETLSAERVGKEMAKLLAAPDPAKAVATMRSCGALPVVLPGSDDRWLGPVVHLQEALSVDRNWLTRLAALGGQNVTDRMRLSKAQARALEQIQSNAFAGPPLGEVAYRLGQKTAEQVLILRSAMAEVMPDTSQLDTISSAASAKFPISAKDLMPGFAGPALGARMRTLETAWITSDFALTRAELLALP